MVVSFEACAPVPEPKLNPAPPYSTFHPVADPPFQEIVASLLVVERTLRLVGATHGLDEQLTANDPKLFPVAKLEPDERLNT